ncbi:MAG: hypothetical protein H8E10_17910 [Desulfobacterales bacterium]|nr:hypothetical protein [Desulfobacterales bacterium]
MIQEHREELRRLAELSAAEIGDNENNVKYNFIIPFLEAFGYNKNLYFEHSAQGNRIDILIDKVSDHNILIEAKSYGRSLDDYVSQLKRYCDEKRPIVAIITNGEEARFYSPFWRKPAFAETLIYSIDRRQLSEDSTVERIEAILDKKFLEDGSIVEHIEDREKEMTKINKQMESFDSHYQEKITEIVNSTNGLEEQIKSFQSQIDKNKADVTELRREKEQKMDDLKKQHLFRLAQAKQPATLLPPVAAPAGQRRPLGRRRYQQLTDYLIPVIRLIKSGVKHSDAFGRIADNLGVKKQTAQAECTVQLDHISTEKFVELIKSNQIKSFLKERFPDKANFIEKEI